MFCERVRRSRPCAPHSQQTSLGARTVRTTIITPRIPRMRIKPSGTVVQGRCEYLIEKCVAHLVLELLCYYFILLPILLTTKYEIHIWDPRENETSNGLIWNKTEYATIQLSAAYTVYAMPLHINFHPDLTYSAFTDKVERNCHFPVPGRNCITHRQALQGFPDTSHEPLHKNN
jgi:hypothetical protein